MWKSFAETRSIVEDLDDLERLDRLFSLKCFWKNAVFPDDYKADDLWLDLLIVTDTDDYISEVAKIRNCFAEPDFLLALFGIFYHHDLFFDWKRSNISGISTLLENELLKEQIRLPYRFGRCLYDRFNDVHESSRTEHLLPPDVTKLLEGTPQGVYQLGYYISGPLGLIEGQEPRWIPPTLKFPLWHCSDTGCQAIHTVEFIPPTIPFVEAYREIKKVLQDQLGPASEWYPTLRRLHRQDLWQYGRRYADLPIVIANCFVDSERQKILVAALESSHGDALREIIEQPPRTKEYAQGGPTQVTERLVPAAVLQLILTLDDQSIIELTDSLIEGNQINIPIGESRPVRTQPPKFIKDSETEISGFGLRSSRLRPIVFMAAAIKRAYTKRGLVNELEWRIGRDASNSIEEAVLYFIRNNGPREAFRHLVLSSQVVSKEIFSECNIPIPEGFLDSSNVLDRLMWKIGFNPEQYDDSLQRFYARLREFEEKVLEKTPIGSEDDREAVRSSGVNLFVSVEDFLERIIAFNVWLLAADHFVENRFIWDLGKARRIIPIALGKVLLSGSFEHTWSSYGENTLGDLLRYLTESGKWMKNLDGIDRSDLRRTEDELPHYSDDPDRIFPFQHRQLWADTDIMQLRRYSEGYDKIVTLLEQADLAEIRNGLDHYRDAQRFPESDKMLACASRLRQALELADVNRYVPKIYWLYNETKERFGFVEFVYRDYAERRVVIRGPHTVIGLPSIHAEVPVVIAPGNLLGYPNSTLMFQVSEDSEYLQYWDGYPRRRKIPPEKLILPTDGPPNSETISDQ